MEEQNKRRRDEFTKSLEVKGNSNSKIVPINRSERYTAPKDTMKKVSKSQRSKRKRRIIRNRMLTLGMVGLLAFGGYQAYKSYNENNNTITLEQAVENGMDIDELGIDPELQAKIFELEEKIEQEDLTNEELMDLASEINAVQFDTIKSKIADTLGVNKSKIAIWTNDTGEGATVEKVEIEDGETYRTKELFGNKKTISKDISKFIKETGEMQTLSKDVKTQNINRSKLIDQYEEAIRDISEFAAMKVIVDKDGNLIVEKTKESEFEEQTTNNQAKIENDNELEI